MRKLPFFVISGKSATICDFLCTAAQLPSSQRAADAASATIRDFLCAQGDFAVAFVAFGDLRGLLFAKTHDGAFPLYVLDWKSEKDPVQALFD